MAEPLEYGLNILLNSDLNAALMTLREQSEVRLDNSDGKFSCDGWPQFRENFIALTAKSTYCI